MCVFAFVCELLRWDERSHAEHTDSRIRFADNRRGEAASTAPTSASAMAIAVHGLA